MVESIKVVRAISELIAQDLIVQRGANVTDTAIAIAVADAVEELTQQDANAFIKLIRAYIKVADVHVGIPAWRVADDGTLKTQEELEEEMKF